MSRRSPESTIEHLPIVPADGLEEFLPADEAQTAPETIAPRRRSPAAGEADGHVVAVSGSAGKGWAAHRKHKQERTAFARELQVADGEERLVKFLDDEPFDSYYRHWLRNVPKGRQTYVCLGTDCPLCDIGDQPTFVVLFNVVDLTDPADASVKVWAATPNPAGAIEERAFNSKTSPISREDLYFSVTKKKQSNGFFGYTIDPVKSRDLEDDWEMEPLSPDKIAGYAKQKHGSEFIRADSKAALKEVAEHLED